MPTTHKEEEILIRVLKKQNNPRQKKRARKQERTKTETECKAQRKKKKLSPRAVRNYTQRHPTALEVGKLQRHKNHQAYRECETLRSRNGGIKFSSK